MCRDRASSKSDGELAPRRLVDLRLKGLKGITDETLAAIAKHCPLLTSLDASGEAARDRLTDVGVAALADGCPRLQTCAEIVPRLCRHASRRFRLVTRSWEPVPCRLHLAGCRRVGDEGVAAVAAGCRALRLLDLQVAKLQSCKVTKATTLQS